jgi:hypothetical protein
MNGRIWRATVRAPDDVVIAKQRYWAIYDPNFHEFVISGVEKIEIKGIDNALPLAKGSEEELVLGYWKGWNKALKPPIAS